MDRVTAAFVFLCLLCLLAGYTANGFPPHWIATTVGTNLALVLVGGLTAAFISWQAWETRNAAQVTARQLTIQQRSSRQWVDIGNWRNVFFGPEHQDEVTEIHLGCDVSNPTNVPLRLNIVSVAIFGNPIENIFIGTFLPPKYPYPIKFRVLLNDQQAAKFDEQGFRFYAELSVFFTDAFDNKWEQILGRTILCRDIANPPSVEEGRTTIRRDQPGAPEEHWPERSGALRKRPR